MAQGCSISITRRSAVAGRALTAAPLCSVTFQTQGRRLEKQTDAMMFWDRFEAKRLAGNELIYPQRPDDMPVMKEPERPRVLRRKPPDCAASRKEKARANSLLFRAVGTESYEDSDSGVYLLRSTDKNSSFSAGVAEVGHAAAAIAKENL